MVAARCGAKVILTDLAEAPSCLENCRRSCQANGVRDMVVLGLTWGDLSPDLILLPKLDLILGSDVFYDPEGQHMSSRCLFSAGFWCPQGSLLACKLEPSCFRFRRHLLLGGLSSEEKPKSSVLDNVPGEEVVDPISDISDMSCDLS